MNKIRVKKQKNNKKTNNGGQKMSGQKSAKQVLECRISAYSGNTMNACSDFTDYFLCVTVCCANTMVL